MFLMLRICILQRNLFFLRSEWRSFADPRIPFFVALPFVGLQSRLLPEFSFVVLVIFEKLTCVDRMIPRGRKSTPRLYATSSCSSFSVAHG